MGEPIYKQFNTIIIKSLIKGFFNVWYIWVIIIVVLTFKYLIQIKFDVSDLDELVASKTKNDSFQAIRSSWLSIPVETRLVVITTD